MGQIEDRLRALGVPLPAPPTAVANYLPGVRVGELLFVSATMGTVKDADGADRLPIRGSVGADIGIEDGYRSARLTALNELALAKAVLGDLDRIVRVVKLVGYVYCAPGFTEAPKVLNGASDLMVEVFGPERGRHARSAVYQHAMSGNAPIEIETTFQVTD